MLNVDGDCHASIHFHVRHDDGFSNKGVCNAWVATAIVGSAVIGGAVQAYSANKAAEAQTNATNTAAGIQTNIFNKTQANLAPYIGAGNAATSELQDRLPALTAPITMDQSTLEKTPGYQFNLTQGLKATQNSAAARGLGISGAALKGAATFTTGLADSTYQNQFNNTNTNNTNAYNRLKGLIDTGESAAAGQGSIGATTGANIGGDIVGGGNAQAAALNKTGNAVNNAFSTIGGYAAYKGLYGSTNGGNPADYGAPGVGSGNFNFIDAQA